MQPCSYVVKAGVSPRDFVFRSGQPNDDGKQNTSAPELNIGYNRYLTYLSYVPFSNLKSRFIGTVLGECKLGKCPKERTNLP